MSKNVARFVVSAGGHVRLSSLPGHIRRSTREVRCTIVLFAIDLGCAAAFTKRCQSAPGYVEARPFEHRSEKHSVQVVSTLPD